MNYSQSFDFQNEENGFQDDEDQIEFEEIGQNEMMMRYENEEEIIEQVKNKDIDEEELNQSEIQKISSTLCMREQEQDYDSEEESEFDKIQSKTCNSGTLQKPIKKQKKYNKEEPKRKIKKWSEEENKQLQHLFQIYQGDWEIIVKFMEGRTVSQCKQHWQRLNGGQDKKKKWTEEENLIILSFTKDNPQFNNWQQIALSIKQSFKRGMQNRNSKQIREHYMNQLRPGINNKLPWNEQQDKLLLQLYSKYGSKWCQINKHFQGRTEIMLKNRFNKLQKGNSYVDHFLNIDDEPQLQQSHTFSFN